MSNDGNLAKPYACDSDDGEWLGCWRPFVLCRSQFTQSPPERVRSLVSGRRAAGGPGWDARSVLVLSDSPRPAVLGRCFGFPGRGLSVCPPRTTLAPTRYTAGDHSKRRSEETRNPVSHEPAAALQSTTRATSQKKNAMGRGSGFPHCGYVILFLVCLEFDEIQLPRERHAQCKSNKVHCFWCLLFISCGWVCFFFLSPRALFSLSCAF